MRSKLLKFGAPILVLIGAAGIVTILNQTAPELEQEEPEIRPVSLFVERVQQSDIPLTVRTQGEVRPKTEISLIPQVTGRIVSVSESFTAGGSFGPGETLVQIDDTDYRLALTRAQSRVIQAETTVQLREADAEIARRNWDDSIGGEATPLALKLPQLEEARAQLVSAQADLEAAQINLERTRISVPFAGRVRAKSADIGQFINAGTPLGIVYSTEVVEVRLPISDSQLASLGLSIGYEARGGERGPLVDFSAIVAGQERHWTGRIDRIEAAIDSNTRMMYAVASVQDPYGAGRAQDGTPLPVGLFVNAEINSQTLTAALFIPREALRADNTVFVVTEDDSLDIRPVRVGYTDERRAVITSGLQAGERVVISPIRAPRQGMAVAAIEDETALAQLAARRSGGMQ